MQYDIGIIGAGPGGYVAAIKAAQLGARVLLIEKKSIGGTCLNLGCIPTKAMLASVDLYRQITHSSDFGINIEGYNLDYNSVFDRQKNVINTVQDGLSKLIQGYKNIEYITGTAKIASSKELLVEDELYNVNNLIISSGSVPGDLPGLTRDGVLIINSDDALNLEKLPESLLIIGGGAIGVEWARIYSAFGVDVALIELMDRLLPTCDKDISASVLRNLKKIGVNVLLKVSVDSLENDKSSLKITLSNTKIVDVEKVMLAVGRRPNLNIDGLEKLGLQMKSRYIKVNEFMQTSKSNIYAIGDVVATPQLAHVASHEGVLAVEKILGKECLPINYNHIPFCVYGQPEVAVVGMTEHYLKQEEILYQSSKFFYAGNGKAIADAKVDGFVKVLYNNTKQILGVSIIGANASDIIHQALLAIKKQMTIYEFKDIVYAHPTLSETFLEAITGMHGPKR